MHLMWSDNGSNFVSAIMSFEKPPKWWQYLQTHRVDWITWVSTTNEALQTLVIEVKTGVNLRPVTADTVNEVKSCYTSTWKLGTSRYLLLQMLEKNTTHNEQILGKMVQGTH